jgi:hypothetical protein
MEAYLDYNLKFLRALQEGDIVLANEYATKIDEIFPGHPNIQNFRDVIATHLEARAKCVGSESRNTSVRRGVSQGAQSSASSVAGAEDEESDDEDDNNDDGSDGDDADDAGDDGPLELPAAAMKKGVPPPAASRAAAPPSSFFPLSAPAATAVPPTHKQRPDEAGQQFVDPAPLAAPAGKKVAAGPAGGSKPSIRDHVMYCREINDDVDAMFADADRQIEEELKKRRAVKP